MNIIEFSVACGITRHVSNDSTFLLYMYVYVSIFISPFDDDI